MNFLSNMSNKEHAGNIVSVAFEWSILLVVFDGVIISVTFDRMII